MGPQLSESASRNRWIRLLCRWCRPCLLVALILSATREAPAQTTSASSSLADRRFSELEIERIRRALTRVRGKVDLQPAGKRIESIEIVTLPVFEPEDLVPQFLNWFHTTTHDYVIEREVLLDIGQPYDQRLSDETERNLRGLFLFSVVVALPLEGSSEDRVRYLIITKDLWSLRLGWNGRINKGVVDYLSLQPTERNLFGTGRQVFGTVVFGRRTYTLGVGYYEPRLAGSRTAILASAEAIFNCGTGEIEGSSGSFQYTRPLYSTQTPWAYATSVGWSNSRNPLVVSGNFGGAICSVRSNDEIAVAFERDSNDRIGVIPNEFLYDSQTFSQSFTRSYGYRYKTNLNFGLEAVRYAYSETSLAGIRISEESEVAGELTDYERQALVNYYFRQLARSDTRISPFFQLTSFTTNFHRDINSETLGLQEEGDFRLGHTASVRIFPALDELGSTRDLLGLVATASYARSVGTGYTKVSVVHDVELARPEQTDAALSLAFRFTSPRLLLGRIVYDARLYQHYRNYRRTRSVLGSTTRLRGFQNAAERGFNYVVGNLEFRSRPIDIFSAQLGGVLFYDVGDAFDTYSELGLRHGVGGGIRFLAPQLDRDVFRIDVGFPVPLDAPRGETTIIATFGQAFGVP
jgi:hypothetical protein